MNADRYRLGYDDDGVWNCSAETGQEVLLAPVDEPKPPRWHRWAWAALAVAVLAAVVALVTSWAVTR